MKLELHEMVTVLVFVEGLPVATIVKEGETWATMFTSDPLRITTFDSREKALEEIQRKLEYPDLKTGGKP